MASNLDRLKAKKAANLKREADLSTSFTIDEGDVESPAAEPAKEITPEPPGISEEKKNAETSSPAAKKSSGNAKNEAKKQETTKPSVPIVPSRPITPINPDLSESPETAGNTIITVPERNLGLRLASDEDKRYLDLAPLGRGTTKKAFFIEIMEKECASTAKIDISAPDLEKFRNSSLKTTAITISVPENLIEKIKTNAARHMMKYQRYIAYVINKARLSDEEWSRINN